MLGMSTYMPEAGPSILTRSLDPDLNLNPEPEPNPHLSSGWAFACQKQKAVWQSGHDIAGWSLSPSTSFPQAWLGLGLGMRGSLG